MENPKKRPLPKPGTALVAFLRRYGRELANCPFSPEASRRLDAIDVLLEAAEGDR